LSKEQNFHKKTFLVNRSNDFGVGPALSAFSDHFLTFSFGAKTIERQSHAPDCFRQNNCKFNALITEPNMKTLEIHSNSEKISEMNVQYIKNSGSIQSPSNQLRISDCELRHLQNPHFEIVSNNTISGSEPVSPHFCIGR
jgi:hypothetical protein